jgi:hypothetical protein
MLAAAALTSGCGGLGKAPLPKSPAAQTTQPTPSNEDWATKLRATDLIYSPLTKGSANQQEPPWRILEILQGSGQRVALGWPQLAAAQQPLLDRWQRQEISTAQLLEELAPVRRDNLLGHALRPDLGQVALGSSRELLTKIRGGQALSQEEQTSLPNGFRPPPDSLQNFTDRVTASSRLRRYSIRRLYRAHLVAEETIAENILTFMRDNPNTKLLVFVPEDLLIDPQEIAGFVSQKMPLRQMILDRQHSVPNERSRLLASVRHPARLVGGKRSGRGLYPRFQVVNRAPGTGFHDCHLAPPWLLAQTEGTLFFVAPK